MNARSFSAYLCILLIGILTPIATAQSIELRLRDGTRWRGAVGEYVRMVVLQNRAEVEVVGEIVDAGSGWLQLRTAVIGEMRTRTIAHADIRSIEKVEAPAVKEPQGSRPADVRGGRTPAAPASKEGDDFKGVFYLPWKGGVGMEARSNEIQAVIEEADRHGRGQIIILDIDSPGGAVIEMQRIAQVIEEGRKRHRIIAWVRKAISAGAATACLCHEIYFATEGSLGAITMLQGGGQSVGPELQQRNARYLGEWFEKAGRPALIAHAMVLADSEVSYDKDEYGNVTWHPNLSGQYVLSRKGQNLVFNSKNAVHSGFAQGIADTKEDLAELLHFPEWREVNDFGRRVHENWVRTYNQAQEEIRLAEFRFANPQGRNAVETLSYQKRQLEEMLRWAERIDIPSERLEGIRRQIRDIERQIAELRRR